ncbi:SMI1/KNR4 family protein [Desulfitobacterium metallireducens]|uniref:Cell wall assembly/cell proliferation coordinating protein n=1 Tax=Desulfitobacterium metallireducens DSM 15288 TaxID=871968 RepID=W0EAP9_9FIRM|nr:SMI1/KNR4 family protein [Desulfitobacterium metallireducens]AHF07945.1 cell wall assembly/cell proliferation coordinating protein [Desulfitobacterium metallireducens DSM 15288]
MDFTMFSKVVNETRICHPVWFGLESDLKSSDEDITFIETNLMLRLPKEYKEFIKEYGGGYFAFTVIFSGIKESEWFIVSKNKEAGVVTSYNFLAVSNNGAGDYYGFKVVDGICESSISVWDHEEKGVKPTTYKNLYHYIYCVGLTNS